ncbi:MAG: hypothetical protein AAF517_19030 [Planctomycetota bacterium]
MIIFGTRNYGKTDNIADSFHVSTRFFHIWFVPLLPLGSYLMAETTDDEDWGISVPFSFKSTLLGWARFPALIAGVCLVLVPVPGGGTTVAGVVCLVMFAVAMFAPQLRNASYDRAVELCEVAQLPAQTRVAVDLHYGEISEHEAQRLFAEIEKDEIEALDAEVESRRERVKRILSEPSGLHDDD